MESIVLNNRYRLVELIGSGGMAVVYRGQDTLLQRRVAIKVLRESFAGDPAFLARFQREAQAVAGLSHPNIVTVYDVGQDGDRHYIVMEYVDGQDLKTLIRQKGHLSIDEALRIAIDVSAGVGHAHKADLIHCDIKPQNVLVTQGGRAKVTDFGIARALSESGLTESETVWGSPLYFSPEQAAGDPPTPASDVYSVGVMMYEMLSGSPPFHAEKPAALALMHMREEPAPLAVRNPQVPPQLEWIIRKVMAKEPSARYRTADQLGHVLEEYRKHGEQVTGWQPATAASEYALPADSRASKAKPAATLSEETLDRLTWILGGTALISVVGLLVLWLGFVVPAWAGRAEPPPIPTATPLVTLTPVPQMIPVPDVVGLTMEEARGTVERAGFHFRVLEERDEPGAAPGTVLEQAPASGGEAPMGSELTVIVSNLGQDVEMFDLVGLPYDHGMYEGLRQYGMEVISDTVWSVEPERIVVAQVPDPGVMLHAGDTVTLTVSGGTTVPMVLDVNMSETILLESVELDSNAFHPGDTIRLTLHWKALRAVGSNYRVFVHLQDSGGPHSTPVAYGDDDPVVPSTRWGVDTVIVDPHQVVIPAGLASGTYQLRVGLYREGGARLVVTDPGEASVEADSILIAEVAIAP